jgi:secondary thiamine-phosphate synthase enzyme
MIDITGEVQRALEQERSGASVCVVFVPHTTAAVTINENADPSVRADILAELDKVIPPDDAYAHDEGNSAAHVKASLVGSSVSVPMENGRLCLGTWQGIFFCEFDGPRQRQAWIQTR